MDMVPDGIPSLSQNELGERMLVSYDKAWSVCNGSIITLPLYKGCTIEFSCLNMIGHLPETLFMMIKTSSLREEIECSGRASSEEEFNYLFNRYLDKTKRLIDKELNMRGY